MLGRSQKCLNVEKRLRQEYIVSEYKSNGPSGRKRHRTTDYAEVNDAVYKWYCLARQRCIPVSGPLLQEEALQIALGIDPNTCFKAFRLWRLLNSNSKNSKQTTLDNFIQMYHFIIIANTLKHTSMAWTEQFVNHNPY